MRAQLSAGQSQWAPTDTWKTEEMMIIISLVENVMQQVETFVYGEIPVLVVPL